MLKHTTLPRYASSVLPTLLLIAFCLSWARQSQAQNETQSSPLKTTAPRPQGSVAYRQQFGSSEALTATLVFANQKSLYYHSRKGLSQTTSEFTEVADMHFVKNIEDDEGQCVYKDREQNKLVSRLYDINRNILLEEPVPTFKWVLDSTTKTIGTYRVQKATTTFRGRQYEAWFAPDIPLPLGPWKLGGLPGLILEAYDSQKQFRFEAIAISLPTQVTTPVCPPVEGEQVIGWDAYCLRTKAATARMIKFMQAKSPGVIVNVTRSGSLEIIE